MRYLASLQDALTEILDENQNAHILGEDICAPYGGAFKVTLKASQKHPDRVLNTPICEASIVGMATGMAIRGFPAIVEIMFGDFILIAADQIINEASKFRAMFDNRLDVPLVIRTPMGAGRGYGPVHSQSLEKFFLGVQGLKVVSPSHFHNPGQLLINSVNEKSPILFAEHKLLYPRKLSYSQTIENSHNFPTVLTDNHGTTTTSDVVIIGYGGMSKIIDDAMLLLAEEEIYATAIYPSLISEISPYTIEAVIKNIPKSSQVFIVDEVEKDFGWSTNMSLSLIKSGISPQKIHIIARDCEIIPTCFDLEQELIMSSKKITSTIYQKLGL